MEGKVRRGGKEKIKWKTRDRERGREEEKRKAKIGGEGRHTKRNKKEASKGKRRVRGERNWERERGTKRRKELCRPCVSQGLSPPSALLTIIITPRLIKVCVSNRTSWCKTFSLMRNGARQGLASLLSQNSVQEFPSTSPGPSLGSGLKPARTPGHGGLIRV